MFQLIKTFMDIKIFDSTLSPGPLYRQETVPSFLNNLLESFFTHRGLSINARYVLKCSYVRYLSKFEHTQAWCCS